MSRWFRHYAGMMRDDKLVRAALKSGQSVERVVWIWGAILESAAELDDDGRYDLDHAEIAWFLRADEADIRAVEASLENGGRIGEGRVTKWGDRQFKSDTSTDRVRKHRLSKGGGNGGHVEGQDEPERFNNDGVTFPQRSRNAPDTEAETERKTTASVGEGPLKVSDLYSEVEVKRLQLQFDRVSVENVIPSVLRWCARKGIERTNEKRDAVFKSLKRRQDEAAAQDVLIERMSANTPTGPPAEPTSALLATRLVSGRRTA